MPNGRDKHVEVGLDGCRSCELAPSKLDWFGWGQSTPFNNEARYQAASNEGKLMTQNRAELNRNLAQMLKGGVIMDVTTPEQAKIAQDAGACAVMALERIPADIRAAGGVSRMSDPAMIKGIQAAVSIPIMGEMPHRALRRGTDPPGHRHRLHRRIRKCSRRLTTPTTSTRPSSPSPSSAAPATSARPCACIAEGATMIRTKGEPGTGDVVQAVRHMRRMNAEIRRIQNLRDDELFEAAEGAASAGGAAARGARGRQAARRELWPPRHRHPGRRGPYDAAGRRGRLRGRGIFKSATGPDAPRPS